MEVSKAVLDRPILVKLRKDDYNRLAKIAKEKGDVAEATLARTYIIDGIKRDENHKEPNHG